MFQRVRLVYVIYLILLVREENYGAHFWTSCFFCSLKIKDLSDDGTVDKQEFDQVMKEKGDKLNQDQINIFNKIFQQDENSKVTYERMYSFFFMNQ